MLDSRKLARTWLPQYRALLPQDYLKETPAKGAKVVAAAVGDATTAAGAVGSAETDKAEDTAPVEDSAHS